MAEHYLAKQWELALQANFPGVVVKLLSPQEANELPLFDVFLVPNEKRRDFVRFLMKDCRVLAQERNLPLTILVPHTVSETEVHYPDIWNMTREAGAVKMTRSIVAENMTPSNVAEFEAESSFITESNTWNNIVISASATCNFMCSSEKFLRKQFNSKELIHVKNSQIWTDIEAQESSQVVHSTEGLGVLRDQCLAA